MRWCPKAVWHRNMCSQQGIGKLFIWLPHAEKARHFERYPWQLHLAGQRKLLMTFAQSKALSHSSRLGASLLTTLFKSKDFERMTALDWYANKLIPLSALKESVMWRQDIAQCHFQNKVGYFLPTSIWKLPTAIRKVFKSKNKGAQTWGIAGKLDFSFLFITATIFNWKWSQNTFF